MTRGSLSTDGETVAELVRIVADHGDTLGIGAMLVGVLALFFRQLATGKLLFAAEVDKRLAEKQAELERNNVFADKLVAIATDRADKYEAAYVNEASARAAQADTLETLLEFARAADYLLRALPSSKTVEPPPVAREKTP